MSERFDPSMTFLIILHFFREKKREREREELWRRLHELADEIQKGDKHGTIGSLPALPASAGGSSASSENPLNSTATQNNSQAATAQSHTLTTQLNSLSISAAAGSMSKWCNSNGKSKSNKIECCWFF